MSELEFSEGDILNAGERGVFVRRNGQWERFYPPRSRHFMYAGPGRSIEHMVHNSPPLIDSSGHDVGGCAPGCQLWQEKGAP